jgi:hypothetical protein
MTEAEQLATAMAACADLVPDSHRHVRGWLGTARTWQESARAINRMLREAADSGWAREVAAAWDEAVRFGPRRTR